MFLATLMLVSLFAVVSSTANVSGTTMAATGPAPTSWTKDGDLDIFAVDTSGHLWYTSVMPNGGGIWNPLGGVATSSPAATSRNGGGMTVFVRGTDGAVWYRDYGGGSWSKWTSIGGRIPFGTAPAACSWGAGRLDAFVTGTDGMLYHKWYANGAWSAWQSLGGKLTSSPAASSPLGGGSVIDVFVRGADSAVWYREWNVSAWSGWKSLGGKVAPYTGPAATQFVDLFCQGTDHQLYQTFFPRGTWSAFNLEPPEALSIASPGAVTTGFTNMHPLVCVSSTSGNVWYSVRDSVGHWEQWYSLGSPP